MTKHSYRIAMTLVAVLGVFCIAERGSKRESQKIPSFRMMKIQSTPRLT